MPYPNRAFMPVPEYEMDVTSPSAVRARCSTLAASFVAVHAAIDSASPEINQCL
jgi:hypothetical protein